MASTPLSSNTHDGHGHHVIPLSWLILNVITLMLLMGLTIFAAEQQAPSIGPIPGVVVNNIIALAIACFKAFLVIWIFMGVKFASVLTRIWVAVGFIVMILLFGILGDYYTRKFEPVAGWEVNQAHGGETALPRVWPPDGRVTPPDNVNAQPRFPQGVNPNH